MEKNCTFKRNGDSVKCGKCAGEHNTRECVSDVLQCINCMRFSKEEINHSVNDKTCTSMGLEVERLKSITDHGY